MDEVVFTISLEPSRTDRGTEDEENIGEVQLQTVLDTRCTGGKWESPGKLCIRKSTNVDLYKRQNNIFVGAGRFEEKSIRERVFLERVNKS